LALESVTRSAGPRTLLARVQAAWPAAAGPVIAAESEPVSERAGTVTVACSSAVWAQELELLEPDFRERLNGALEGSDGARLEALRFRVGATR
jgi:predicted nucleic acid-binding Zn ribbon protein